MLNRRQCLLLGFAFATIGCQPPPEPGGGGGGGEDMVPGFAMTLDKSSFYLGTLEQTTDFGRLKRQVGTYGVYGTYVPTDGVLAISNADSPIWDFAPLTSTMSDHNTAGQAYFVAAGLPIDQVRYTAGLTQVQATEEIGRTSTGGVTRYVAVVQRAVSSIPVVDSSAAVSLVIAINPRSDAGVPITGAAAPPPSTATVAAYEKVYWPAFPRSLLNQAVAFERRLSNPQARAAYIARLPTRNKMGNVVIRHSNWRQTPFVSFVSYDVMDGQTMRHFDQSGQEEFLPSETQPLPPANPFPFDGGS
jgi:hypothetical protein